MHETIGKLQFYNLAELLHNVFYVTLIAQVEMFPKQPFRAKGDTWSRGWFRPTMWVIDANGDCFVNDGQGGPVSTRRGLPIGRVRQYHDK